MSRNLLFLSVMLLGSVATIVTYQNSQRVNRKPSKPPLPPKKPAISGHRNCPPMRCLSTPNDEECCLVKNGLCNCHCVENQRQCSAESTQRCGLQHIPICSNKYGKTTCQCATRGQNKPPLPPMKPQTSVGTNRPSCSLPPTPCDVKSSKLCCLVMYPKCQCKCVAHDTSCSVSWRDDCKPPHLIDCEKTAGERVCRCGIRRPQLQGVPPSTSSGGQTGIEIAEGGTSGRSCSLPSTPCDVKTTKLCCFVMYPNCQCKCVPDQISCSISWRDKCKAPHFMDCGKDAGQRVCRCVSAASKPSG